MDSNDRANKAKQSFLSGCNCPQSVVSAFSDVFEEHGIDMQTALRMASPFGGGMGRLREVCGAVSGMLMVLGLLEGYADVSDYDAKKDLYAHVQTLAERFRAENGSILCRELLGLSEGPDSSAPERRSDEYYERRPCPELVASAARILEEYLGG